MFRWFWYESLYNRFPPSIGLIESDDRREEEPLDEIDSLADISVEGWDVVDGEIAALDSSDGFTIGKVETPAVCEYEADIDDDTDAANDEVEDDTNEVIVEFGFEGARFKW